MKHDERGVVNPLLISTILLGVLLVAACGAFVWAYASMTDWQKNGQAKIDAAVDEAKDQQKKDDRATFTEEQKKPYSNYVGPAALGSVRFNYPKTWASYTAESSSTDLQVYFNPQNVPKVNPDVTPYALRVVVSDDNYAEVLEDYKSDIEDGVIRATPITIGATQGFAGYQGTRIDGQLSDTINGAVVIFPVRNQTLKIYVDSQDYMNDFNTVVLASLQFQQ